jgi:hypothetical protein
MTQTPTAATSAVRQPPRDTVTVSGRALRTVLHDALQAADTDDLPMLEGVYLYTTEAAGGATTLTGLATDRMLAIQASAIAHGQFPGVFLEATHVQLLIEALTARLAAGAVDSDVTLVRDPDQVWSDDAVTLYWGRQRDITVPVSVYEFPLAVLRSVIDQPPAHPTPSLSAFSQDYLHVLVQIAVQRGLPLHLTVPGGQALAHITIGAHCQAWLMPSGSDAAPST